MSQLLDISDEELEKDIAEILLEIKAYNQLAEAYLTLSNLSYTIDSKKRQYHWEHIKYKEFEGEADSYLHQMLDLKRQRTDKNLPLTDI